MKDPVEVLTDDGDVQLLYTYANRIIITDSEGNVLKTIHLLPGFKDGMHYEQ
jgi:hypothetical protein